MSPTTPRTTLRLLQRTLKELQVLQELLDDAETLPPALSRYHTNDRLMDVITSLEQVVADVGRGR